MSIKNAENRQVSEQRIERRRVMKMLVVTIFSLTLSLSIFAQNAPTPYQKKQLELAKKYFQILYGYQMTMADAVFFEQLAEGKDVRDFLLGLGFINYMATHSEAQCESLFTQMEKEYKAAEKLKNATDLKLEEEAKERAAQKEKDAEDRAAQEAYENLDAVVIRKGIKSEFEKWNAKGEFEKENDYISRLEHQSQTVFDSICLKHILLRESYISIYFANKRLSYNAEDEFFTFLFEYNNIECKSIIKVPIAQAENFKNDFKDINLYFDDYDWVYVENNLFPTFWTTAYPPNAKFRDKPKYSSSITPVTKQTETTEITEPFDNLGIDNKYLKGYIFKLSEAKRMDSLKLASLNSKLDSIYNGYNNKLLQNPYNRAKTKLNYYSPITVYTDNTYKHKTNRQYEFDRQVSNMKSEFDRFNESFNTTHRNEYKNNGKLFGSIAEFDSFYIQDDYTYYAEVEKRTKLNYLKEKSRFIETMDFQNEDKPTAASAILSSYTGSYTDYAKINAERNEILSFINKNEKKVYYSQILDYVIEKNIGLNKEWNKNGYLFESKKEFYNAFISGSYKNILKEKKKKNR